MSRATGRYGRRLSAEERDARAVRIHDLAGADAPPASPAELDRRVRALELDLAIDWRIGVDFPPDQRADLLDVRERMENERKALVQRMLQRDISREQFAAGMQGLVDGLVKDLSSVLEPDEVKEVLGIPTLGAALPLDPARIRLPDA